MTATWIKRFLKLADLVSEWSKDPSSKIGAVIVDKYNRVVSTGYNGFAVGVGDSEDRLSNREVKYKMILHAEENAIMFSKRDLSGCSLFVTGLPPCPHCASLIVQSGIRDIYVRKDTVIPDRWIDSMKLSEIILYEGMVKVHKVDKDGREI